MSDPLIAALLGHEPWVLTEDVSLATPFLSSRITGRDAVVAALGASADVIGATDADLRLSGEDLEGVVFTTTVEGHTAQVAALVTRDAAGLIATVDVYGRPWPYMALIRERLAEVAPNLIIAPALGASPPEERGTSWIDPPAVPPLADDVTLFSPILTAEPKGKAVIERVLVAAARTYRDPKFRAVLDIDGQSGFAAVLDEFVEGHVLHLVEIFTLNAAGEVAEIRIFTRPWAVAGDFRQGMHERLKDILGPEFWESP